MIDWERTTAWGEGGYYCRLFLNVAGREPQGTVAPEDYERVRDELKEKLEALGDEQGRPIGTVAHRPEELYAERNGIAARPDRSTSATSTGAASARSAPARSTSSRTTPGPTTRTTRTRGCTCSPRTASSRAAAEERDLRDVAPTLLDLLGEPVPGRDGRNEPRPWLGHIGPDLGRPAP